VTQRPACWGETVFNKGSSGEGNEQREFDWGKHPMSLGRVEVDFAMLMSDTAVVLLAEDREDDILLVKRAFAQAQIRNPMQIVRTGEEAIAYLAGEGKFANRAEYPLPSLLLLDLTTPVLDGFEVLRWIRKHSTLSSLRVLVLTVSNRIQDVNHAYELGANSFLVKPTDFEQTVYLSNLIKEYWLRTDAGPTVTRPDRKKQAEGDRR